MSKIELQKDEATFRRALTSHTSGVLCLRLNNQLHDVNIFKDYLRTIDPSISILIICPPAFTVEYRETQVAGFGFDVYDESVSWKPTCNRVIVRFEHLTLVDLPGYDLVIVDEFKTALPLHNNGTLKRMLQHIRSAKRAIMTDFFINENDCKFLTKLGCDYMFVDCNPSHPIEKMNFENDIPHMMNQNPGVAALLKRQQAKYDRYESVKKNMFALIERMTNPM